MLLQKTTDQIISESVRSLQERGVVTNLNTGGIARALVEVVGGKIGELYDTMAINMAMKYPSTAVGVYLDLIGESMGISRLPASKPFVNSADRVIRFYVRSGRLASYIPSKTIPINTRITSADQSITFIVTTPAYFDDIDTEVFVSAEATTVGTAVNVGMGVLNTQTLASNVFVENTTAISNGRDVEGDESYRFRIMNGYLALQQANPTAIRLAVMSLPDVADVRIREYAQGVGTCEILIVPTTSTLSTTTINRANRALDLVRAMGTRVVIREPDYVPLEINVQLKFKAGTTPQQQASIRASVKQNILNYIDSITIGGTFVINELRQVVMQTDDNIFDMGILCFAVNRRPQIPTNYTLDDDQLFVLDRLAQEPLTVI